MTMKILSAVCVLMGMLVWGAPGTLYAEPRANHRVALMLSGQDCSAHHEAIAQKLYQIPGVARVNMNLIADHVLIDRVQDHRTAEDFQTIVNDVIPQNANCRAEIMESCISAPPIPPTSPH